MILSENIYFLLLFTLPAAINIIFNAYIRCVPQKEKDKSVELASSILFCLAVFFLNLILMHKEVRQMGECLALDSKGRQAFCTAQGFDYFRFMVKYFLVNLLSSAAVVAVWYSAGQWLFRKAKNIINSRTGRPEEVKYPDVWKNLFETKEIVDIGNAAVKIEKDGEMITAGLIRLYPSPESGTRELALYNTDRVREIFEEDQEKDVKHRIFPYADCEYYDFDTGTLIKIYNLDNYDRMPENKRDEPE